MGISSLRQELSPLLRHTRLSLRFPTCVRGAGSASEASLRDVRVDVVGAPSRLLGRFALTPRPL
jgi:hypothetical protein